MRLDSRLEEKRKDNVDAQQVSDVFEFCIA